jgi:hypothetical protein
LWTSDGETYSEVEHARLLGLAEVLALGNLSVGVELDTYISNASLRCDDQGNTYAKLLIIAGTLLARSLELLAHLADLLVGLGVLCGRHFGKLWPN